MQVSIKMGNHADLRRHPGSPARDRFTEKPDKETQKNEERNEGAKEVGDRSHLRELTEVRPIL